MEVAAFWLAVAAVLIAGGWLKYRGEAIKHETLLRIVEKTGTLNEAQLQKLISPAPAPRPDPGDFYTLLRILGTIAIFVAAGLLVFFSILWIAHAEDPDDVMHGVAASFLVAIIGAGVFFSSRFTKPRPRLPGDRPME